MTVGLVYLIVNIVMGSIIEPVSWKRARSFNSYNILVTNFLGWLLGPVGYILSVPLTMIVKIALESNDDTRWIAILLSRNVKIREIFVNYHLGCL